jgi:hypothetical protein
MKIIASMIFLLFVIDALALTEKAFIDKVLNQDTNFEKDKIYVAIKQIELDASKRSYADWNADLSASLLNSYRSPYALITTFGFLNLGRLLVFVYQAY